MISTGMAVVTLIALALSSVMNIIFIHKLKKVRAHIEQQKRRDPTNSGWYDFVLRCLQ